MLFFFEQKKDNQFFPSFAEPISIIWLLVEELFKYSFKMKLFTQKITKKLLFLIKFQKNSFFINNLLIMNFLISFRFSIGLKFFLIFNH